MSTVELPDEQGRVHAERVRERAEDGRQDAEQSREVTEEHRDLAESSRKAAEQFRVWRRKRERFATAIGRNWILPWRTKERFRRAAEDARTAAEDAVTPPKLRVRRQRTPVTPRS